jgi:hypothetical protein
MLKLQSAYCEVDHVMLRLLLQDKKFHNRFDLVVEPLVEAFDIVLEAHPCKIKQSLLSIV